MDYSNLINEAEKTASNTDDLNLNNGSRKLTTNELRYFLSGALQSLLGNSDFMRKYNVTQQDLNEAAMFLENNENALEQLDINNLANLGHDIRQLPSFTNNLNVNQPEKLRMLKQAEIESKYGYPNTLCNLTSLFNLYRKNNLLSDEEIDSFMTSPSIRTYLKPDGSVNDFGPTSMAIAKSINQPQYFNYVYPKEIGRQMLKLTEDDFKKSNEYQYGIGEYYKTPDFGITEENINPNPDHYELITNNPYEEINPGIKNYYLRQIRPVKMYNIPEDK